MVSPTCCYRNNNIDLNENKKINKDINSNFDLNNKFIIKEKFNKESENIKLKLDEALKDYTPKLPDYSKNHLSILEESIINESQYVKNSNNENSIVEAISTIQYAANEINNSTFSSSHSLRDFFSDVKSSIVASKHDYLDVLKSNFSNYMNYVNDFREVMSKLTEYTKAANKDGYINVNFKSFHERLIEIKTKYENMKGEESIFYFNLVFEHKDNGSYTREVAGDKLYYHNKNQVIDAVTVIENLLKDLKGIKITKVDNEIERNIDIKFIGNVDFSDLNKFIESIDISTSEVKGILSDSQLKEKRRELINQNTSLFGNIRPGFDIEAEMKEVIKENDNKKEEAKGRNILQTEFDLFKKSIDTLEKRINTNLEELSKKYSTANSNFDNFVKIVSSTMNTLLEMAKNFLRF